MEWLKDKKNLPIVIGIAVFVLLLSGGLMALELGLFGGSAPTPAPAIVAGRGGPTPASAEPDSQAPTATPHPMPGPPPGPPMGIMSRGPAPAAKTAAAPATPVVVDPTKGPDPFNIPGAQKKMASLLAGKGVYGMKAPLRDILPTLNLFKPPVSAPAPLPPTSGGESGSANSGGPHRRFRHHQRWGRHFRDSGSER